MGQMRGLCTETPEADARGRQRPSFIPMMETIRTFKHGGRESLQHLWTMEVQPGRRETVSHINNVGGTEIKSKAMTKIYAHKHILRI